MKSSSSDPPVDEDEGWEETVLVWNATLARIAPSSNRRPLSGSDQLAAEPDEERLEGEPRLEI